jgi:hypothetical protein
MKIEVSNITKLLTRAFEAEAATVLRHHVFEALKRNDLPESKVNGFGTGLRSQDFGGLVSQLSVQADGCDYHIYKIANLYI